MAVGQILLPGRQHLRRKRPHPGRRCLCVVFSSARYAVFDAHLSSDIVFSQDTPDGVNSKTLEYGPLKTLGDQRVKQLMSKLNLSGSGGSSTGAGSSSTETASSEPTSTDSSEPSMTATMWDPIATSTVDTTAAPTSTSCKTKKNKKKGSKKSSKRSEETKKSVKRTYRRSAKA